MSRSIPGRLLWILCAASFLPVAAGAEEERDRAPPPAAPARPATDRLAPAEVVKPVVPGKSELAESAFKKLDAAGKGYVTMEDARGLEGFDQAFRAADTQHTGRLDLAQFKKAWAQYSGYKE